MNADEIAITLATYTEDFIAYKIDAKFAAAVVAARSLLAQLKRRDETQHTHFCVNCESMGRQLAESQRREKAATRDLEYVCGPSGEFDYRSICDICRHKQTDGTCPTQCEMNSLAASNKWQWRGPIEAGEESR